VHERYRRQADGRQHIANVNMTSRSLKTTCVNLRNVLYTLSVAAARSSPEDYAIPYVLPVLGMRSCFSWCMTLFCETRVYIYSEIPEEFTRLTSYSIFSEES